MMIPRDLYSYAVQMEFAFRIMVDGEQRCGGWVREVVFPSSEIFDPSYNDLVFVHSEVEAQEFPDNVIVAWPREDGNFAEYFVAGINIRITRTEEDLLSYRGRPMREVINIDDFGLTYPITVADLVDNWERVRSLWRAFTQSEQSSISASAATHAHIQRNREATLAAETESESVDID